MSRNFESDVLNNRRKINLNLNFVDLLQTRNYINNCDEVLD